MIPDFSYSITARVLHQHPPNRLIQKHRDQKKIEPKIFYNKKFYNDKHKFYDKFYNNSATTTTTTETTAACEKSAGRRARWM